MKLNIGCGRDYRDDWINCDVSKVVKADKYFDIREGLPFENNSIREIYASGVLNEILLNEDLVKVMNECHRVLMGGGKLRIVVASARTPNSFKDPFECRHFTEETFAYFIEGSHEHRNFGSVYGFRPWKLQSLVTNKSGIITAVLMK